MPAADETALVLHTSGSTGRPICLSISMSTACKSFLALESRGVSFSGETMDSGVCFQAYFSDPDGNALMLHHRYAPYADGSTP